MSRPHTQYFTGRFVRPNYTPDHPKAAAEVLLVRDGRIVALGSRDEVTRPPGASHVDLPDGWVLPGLIEPHGHPSQAAAQLSPDVVDIRPVTVDSAVEVWARIKSELANDRAFVMANGWDPLLQPGLTSPTIDELDRIAGSTPLVIVHNSGHSLFFNSAAARAAGVNRDTPNPAGASYGRDAGGNLTGVAYETAAVLRLAAPLMQQMNSRLPELMHTYLRSLRAQGITTVGDLSWERKLDPLIEGLRVNGRLPTRIRGYEMSAPGARATIGLENGDTWLRQVGVKVWCDGSPWVGNIAASFPYLDTPATRAMGLPSGHLGTANYSTDELIAVGAQYAGDGWQLACHAHGDRAIDSTLDAYQELIQRFDLSDHRFRIEHGGLMTPAQFERAARLGVTVSLFVDHLTYWGDVLLDDLFGDRAAGWANAGAATAAGLQVTFHNDGTVTPCEPFQNMAVAETRRSRTGRHLSGGLGIDRSDALKAHTSAAAWQLRSEHEIGSLRAGRFADLCIVDVDPRTAEPELLAEACVLATAVDGVLEHH